MAIGLNHETEIARPNQDSITEVGSVYGSARSITPSGYLLCDGSLVNRTSYSRLFNVISTIYGNGDGSTTFALPDLRGAVPRGAGTSSGYTQNVTVALGSKDNDAVQGHKHRHGNTASTYNIGWDGAGGSIYDMGVVSGSSGILYGDSQSIISDGSNGSPRTTTETKMKNLGMNFFIKF
jgi:hypothetical protein